MLYAADAAARAPREIDVLGLRRHVHARSRARALVPSASAPFSSSSSPPAPARLCAQLVEQGRCGLPPRAGDLRLAQASCAGRSLKVRGASTRGSCARTRTSRRVSRLYDVGSTDARHVGARCSRPGCKLLRACERLAAAEIGPRGRHAELAELLSACVHASRTSRTCARACVVHACMGGVDVCTHVRSRPGPCAHVSTRARERLHVRTLYAVSSESCPASMCPAADMSHSPGHVSLLTERCCRRTLVRVRRRARVCASARGCTRAHGRGGARACAYVGPCACVRRLGCGWCVPAPTRASHLSPARRRPATRARSDATVHARAHTRAVRLSMLGGVNERRNASQVMPHARAR